MTTIAYCNGVMAADRSLTYKHEWCGEVVKIEKFPSGALFGARGDGDGRGLRNVLLNVKTAEEIPLASELGAIDEDVEALFVLPNGDVWYVGSGEYGQAQKITKDYHAVGSGRKYALGNMHATRNAVEGVKAAIEHDLHTDGSIDVIYLDSWNTVHEHANFDPMSYWAWDGVSKTLMEAGRSDL